MKGIFELFVEFLWMIYGVFGGLTGVFETRVFYDTDRIDAVFDKLSSGLGVL